MTSAKLISLLKAEPFNPFRMKLIDGQVLTVDYRRQIAMMPGDSTCIFFESSDGDSYFTIVSLDAISTIEVRKLPPPIREYLERQND
jgi:hypothetical protein